MKNKDDDFKLYAKEAKKRLANGFWDKKVKKWDSMRAEAEAEGKSAEAEITNEKRNLTKQFYFSKQFEEEELFYKKVCRILESKETVINPIKILGEDEGIYDLPPEMRSQKILEISERYKKMLKRFETEHGIK